MCGQSDHGDKMEQGGRCGAVVKRWPKGLASQRKFSTLVSFGHRLLAWTWIDLRRFALTLVELKFILMFLVFLLPNAIRHVQVDRKSSVYHYA